MINEEYRKWLIMIVFTVFVLIAFTCISQAALPNAFEGYAKDNKGREFPNGVNITVEVIDDPSVFQGNTTYHYTTVNNSLTGKNYNITILDPDNPGKHGSGGGAQVHFFIEGYNTTNSTTFVNGQVDTNYNITIDDIPIIINNTNGTPTTGDNFTFNATVTDIIDTPTVYVEYWYGSGSHTNQTMIATGVGDYFERTIVVPHTTEILYFNISANDSSIYWNETGIQNLGNVVDNDAPNTTLEVGEPVHPNGGTNNSNVTTSSVIYLNATDNIGSYYIQYRIWNTTNGWSTWTVGSADTNRSFTLEEEGKNYIEYYSNDTAGNNETHSNVTIWVDETAPDSSVDTISTYWHNSFPLTITASASDSLSGVASVTLYHRFSSDNVTWGTWMQNTTDSSSPYSWSFSFPNGTGYYQFYSIAVDNVSNTESYSAVDAVCGYDTGSPSSSVDSISSYWKNAATTITATASDALSGVASVSLYVRNSTDNTSWSDWWLFGSDTTSAYSFNFDFSNGSGYYQFYSIAVDNATNPESYSGVDAFCGYDATPPTSSVYSLDIGYWAGPSDTIWINATASDDFSGIASVTLYLRYSSDNATWEGWYPSNPDTSSPYAGIFSAINGSGYYQVYSLATDNASNTETDPGSADREFAVDAYNPNTTIDTIHPYWNNTGSVELTVNASDNLSGISSVSFYYYNSSDNITWSGPFLAYADSVSPYNYTFLFSNFNGTGYYRFYSRGVDNVSNTEAEPTNNDTKAAYDNTAPSSLINNQTTGYYSYFQNSSLTITATVNDSSETYGSGISSVRLYYWYHNATDNVTKDGNVGYWNGSFLFGTNSTPWINTSAVTWTFTFPNGTGYYRFCSRVYDNATNAESLLSLGQTNNTECLYNNTAPNAPTRIGPTGTSVSTSANLQWNCTDSDANDTLTYDVYFGTTSSFTSSHLVSANQTAKIYDPSLSSGATYYWKIVAWDNHNASTAGPTWSFKTQSSSGGTGGTGGTGGGDLTGPTTPGNVRCTSSSNDNTPSFAWDASTDAGSGVAGYYVKIDDGDETSVGDVLAYDWTSALSDGTYTFYVKAKDTSGNSGEYGNCSFTIDTSGGITNQAPVADAGGPYSALTFENISFDGSNSSDSDGSIENYTWDFGDGNVSYEQNPVHSYNNSGIFNITLTVTDDGSLTDTNTTTANITLDTDADGYSDDMEESYNTNKTDPEDSPVDSDGDGTPDDPSPDGKYSGDTDDDGDGVSDEIEEKIGSDPLKNDVKEVKIENVTYYLIDEDGDGIADKYYNAETEEYVDIKKQDDGTVLIDIDKNGKWDYIYNPVSGATQVYTLEDKDDGIPWYVYILLVVAIIFIIVFAMFKTGYLYVETEEEHKAKKPEKKKTPAKKKDTKKTTKKKSSNSKSKKK